MSRVSTPTEQESGGFQLKDLASISSSDRQSFVEMVSKIEKKSFPASEAFDFNTELRKKNVRMVLAVQSDESTRVIGYLVYLRMKRLAFLHKICVVEHERGKGVAGYLMHSLFQQLKKTGCCNVQLWVDENRTPARALYESYGFQQIDRCIDYYGPGRTALKMQSSI
ncbi:acetyltransferas-like protein [Lojkania enalia]|uniref:Acetyltransferas-like protein n=1 Tax=Lojkania enalia TaxID=147567 RepID=A0A9P4KI01_9PLEO|nr:acetyltransferas-like protein [Didymosphaeria enalia]